MLWAGRLFEPRYTLLRLTLLTLGGVGYLLLPPDRLTPLSTPATALAVAAIVFGYVGLWSPLTVVIGTSALFSLELFIDAENWTVPKVAMVWAVVELALRTARWRLAAGLLVASAGTILHDWPSAGAQPLVEVFRIAVNVGMPLLLGSYLRATQELSKQAAERSRQQIQQVRAEERRSIAREIHDLVAHHVASIVLRVAVARNVLPLTDPRVREVLDDVHATGTGALADLRKLVALLRDPGTPSDTSFVDPAGLLIALESVADRSRQIGLTVTAAIDPAVAAVDARTALALLRLVQEGLANVAKHAGSAAEADLRITLHEQTVEMDLTDSGGVPSAMSTAAGQPHGLTGLRERVEVLGGTFRAGPGDPGWRLTAILPIGAMA